MDRIAETVVGPEAAGLRLDVFLAKRFRYRSRAEWQRAVRTGEILLDGAKTKSSRGLLVGETVSFRPANPLVEPAVDASYGILSLTDRYVAVNKSGNLPCHPSGVFFHNTLWRLLRDELGKDPHILTRLDRETSGVVLAALDSETASSFTSAMVHGRVRKRYLAIVHGRFSSSVRADGFLSSDPASAIRKKRRFTRESLPESEHSVTVLNPLVPGDDFSLVEALPETGRLHQIRATLHSLGFPLAGDKLYGSDETLFLRFLHEELTDSDRDTLILPGQALHAESLTLERRGVTLEFHAPVPPLWRERFPALFPESALSAETDGECTVVHH